MNTVKFSRFYQRFGLNQHKYRYRFAEEAAGDPRLDEWQIDY